MIDIPKSPSNHNITQYYSALTVDVEDWYHILDSPSVPQIDRWPFLESRIERNIEEMLTLFDSLSVRVTFF